MELNEPMARQALNDAFARTSFLHGVNGAYVEEMQAQYARNPGSVTDEWRLFFESLHEERGNAPIDAGGPSWAVPLERLESNGNADIIGALTGDYAGAEQHIRERLTARAAQGGHDRLHHAGLQAVCRSSGAPGQTQAQRLLPLPDPT